MTGTTMLVVASVAFVGTHFLMSHALRSGMVGALGEKGFAGVYSIVSFLTLGWMIWAYPMASAAAPSPYWEVGRAGWAVAAVLMWIGSILFMGSQRRNPALPRPGKQILKIDDPSGVFAITRHPMMWGFALWAIVHAIVNSTLASLILSFAIAFLALVGAAMQDRKKEALLGDLWRDWKAKTSFIPYGKGLKSADAFALVTGTLVWLAATWLHNPPVGVWAFFG